MSPARFGVDKPVPANLLMIVLIIGGIAAGLNLRKEFFPESDPTALIVTLPYPGASPEEVEQTLARKVEDALADLDEVDELITTLSEGGGGITVELREGIDADEALEEVEREVNSLTDLPEEAEEITVELFEQRLPVIRVAVFGDLDEAVLKRAIRSVEDDLQSLPGMGEILVEGVRDYELRVDVDLEAMLKLGLSLPEVADAVRAAMLEVPGGTVRTGWGDIKVRTFGVPEEARFLRDIIVRGNTAGDLIRLGDIATVREGFVDTQIINRFNGQPAANLTVYKVGDQDIVKIAELTRAYVAGRKGELFPGSFLDQKLGRPKYEAYKLGLESPRPVPAGASLETNTDLARFVEGRLDLLIRNAAAGATLVFLTLLTFLNWRVAMWVGAGLVTAISGTILLMWSVDVTLNLLTMFGLIVVLGLLVDDAIVVAENIQARHDRAEPSLTAAVRGTNEVAWPVVATVLTSIVAFLPLSFIEGRIGDLLGALPLVVACALAMSLVESLLILPSHMGHTLTHRDPHRPGRRAAIERRWETLRDRVLFEKIVPRYAKLLHLALRRRYLAVALAVAAVIVSLGLLKGGLVRDVFLPSQDAETVIVELRMPLGTPIDKTNRMVQRIEKAAATQVEVKNIAAVVGQQANVDSGQTEASAPHVAQMFIELFYVEQRDRESSEVIDSIRQRLEGRLTEVERISFRELSGGPSGADISIRLRGDEPEVLEAAAARIKRELAKYEGVYDIADDNALGQLELQVRLKPWAQAQGFTEANVARQLRGYLFGIDAHTFAERREDIDVRVRVGEQTRRNLSAVSNAWVISPAGEPVPLTEIAEIEEDAAYATIKRAERKRAITITADTAPRVTTNSIVRRLTEAPDAGLLQDEAGVASGVAGDAVDDAALAPLAEVERDFPGVAVELVGEQEQQREAFASLPWGFAAAIVMIYVILAWLFSSYFQPVLVLLAVPFSLVGVLWGHFLMGYDLTFLSRIGFVALAGIVVNDSLIYVRFYNDMLARGLAPFDAALAAGRARFRAILLTTITTVLGLTPLILEQSFQAKFLIPMAIAIAGGLISATVLILILLPCFLLIFEDVKDIAHFLWHGRPRPKPETQRPAEETDDTLPKDGAGDVPAAQASAV